MIREELVYLVIVRRRIMRVNADVTERSEVNSGAFAGILSFFFCEISLPQLFHPSIIT